MYSATGVAEETRMHFWPQRTAIFSRSSSSNNKIAKHQNNKLKKKISKIKQKVCCGKKDVFHLFIYFCLRWAFIATCRLFL